MTFTGWDGWDPEVGLGIASTAYPVMRTYSLGIERIDYIFTSPNIKPIDYRVIIKKMSDHYPIIAKIRI